MRSRDYTKKQYGDAPRGTTVLREAAIRTAEKKLSCIEDPELFSILVDMLVREYYVDHELYNRHTEETK